MVFLYCVDSTLQIVKFHENICSTYFYKKKNICSGELEVEEIVSAPAGLATKFFLKCKQPICPLRSDNSGCHTFPKTGESIWN